jgi:hypothetical protein
MGWGWPRLGDGLATGSTIDDLIQDSRGLAMLGFVFDYLSLF